MADAVLSVELQAKIDAFVADLNRANESLKKTGTNADLTASKVDKLSKGSINSVKSMQIQLESYRRIAETATDPKRLIDYNKKVQTLEKSISQASNVGKEGFDKLGNAVEKSSGAIGGKLFQGLRTAANILPGIGIAGILAFATEPLIDYISKLDLFKVKLTEAKVAQEDVAKALSGSEYAKAVTNINELRINIDAARKGFVDKSEVLRQYNETIGKTTGQVSSLDQAEQALNKNADAFIKFTLLKAAAQVALESAAKKSYEAEISRRKKLEEFSSITDNFGPGNLEGINTVTGEVDLKVRAERQKRILKQREDARKREAKISEDAAKQQLDIATKFQQDALKIAKNNNFQNALGLGDPKKTKSASKTKALELELPDNPQKTISDLFKKLSSINAPDALKVKAPEKIEIVGEKAEIQLGELVDISTIDVEGDKLLEKLEEIAENARKTILDIVSLPNLVDIAATSLGSSFEAMGAAIADGGNVLVAAGEVLQKSFADLLSALGQQFITMGAAKVAAGILATPFGAKLVADGAGLIALGAGLKLGGGIVGNAGKSSKGSSGGVTAFANGGIISGPTLGLMGEYAGAKSDPEVVAPLSKLKKMLGQTDQNGNPTVSSSQTPVYVQQELRIDGKKLVALIRTVQEDNKRIG